MYRTAAHNNKSSSCTEQQHTTNKVHVQNSSTQQQIKFTTEEQQIKSKGAHIQYLQVIVAESDVALSPVCIIVDGFHHVVLNVKRHLQHSDLEEKRALPFSFIRLTHTATVYSITQHG